MQLFIESKPEACDWPAKVERVVSNPRLPGPTSRRHMTTFLCHRGAPEIVVSNTINAASRVRLKNHGSSATGCWRIYVVSGDPPDFPGARLSVNCETADDHPERGSNWVGISSLAPFGTALGLKSQQSSVGKWDAMMLPTSMCKCNSILESRRIRSERLGRVPELYRGNWVTSKFWALGVCAQSALISLSH